MIYMTGHISGGNLNPSVTMSLLWAGKIEQLLAFEYIFAQVAGALLASWIAHGCIGNNAAYPKPQSWTSTSTATQADIAKRLTGLDDWTATTDPSTWQTACSASNSSVTTLRVHGP